MSQSASPSDGLTLPDVFLSRGRCVCDKQRLIERLYVIEVGLTVSWISVQETLLVLASNILRRTFAFGLGCRMSDGYCQNVTRGLVEHLPHMV